MARQNRHLKKKHKKKKLLYTRFKHKKSNFNRKEKRKNSQFTEATQYIRQLTTKKLSNNEVQLLSKGLKFIPSPLITNARNCLLRDWKEVARKMRCKFHFDDGSDNCKLHPFLQKSGHVPPPANAAIESFLFHVKNDLERMPITRKRKNLTNGELQALHSLRKNKNLVIKKADKNSTTVVLDKERYIKQALTHLSGNTHYEILIKSRSEEIKMQLNTLINQLYKNRFIDKITYKYLTEKRDEKIGRLYMLSKIHKLDPENLKLLENNELNSGEIEIPGRPIISLCGSPTERIGHYFNYFLQEIVPLQWTYTKDTTYFINEIEKITLPNDTIMASFDVTSMYTNMEHVEILDAIERAWPKLESRSFEIPLPPKDIMLQILKLIIENNEFEFNGVIYRQKIGVPMGAPMSPSLTDIRMFEIMTDIIDRFAYKNNLIHLSVYRDDGFLLFTGSKEELVSFFEIANQIHPFLKFTFEISTESLHFLDVTVFKGQRFQTQNILDVRLYRKPTDNYQYLPRSSAHPKSVFKGFVIGEIIRFIRCSNNNKDLEYQIHFFRNKLLARGYKIKEINNWISIGKNIRRNTALQYKEKTKNKKPPLVFATKYNPCFRQLGKILRKHWHYIENNTDTKSLFPRPPIIAFKKHNSLKDLLTSAKLRK